MVKFLTWWLQRIKIVGISRKKKLERRTETNQGNHLKFDNKIIIPTYIFLLLVIAIIAIIKIVSVELILEIDYWKIGKIRLFNQCTN